MSVIYRRVGNHVNRHVGIPFYRLSGKFVRMRLGERIDRKRREMGLSQSELARRARMPQTTLNSLIHGNSRWSPHLLKIAQELQTTPEMLAGESTDLDVSSGSETGLNSEERELLENYRAIEARDRKAISQLARSIASTARTATVHDQRKEFRGA